MDQGRISKAQGRMFEAQKSPGKSTIRRSGNKN